MSITNMPDADTDFGYDASDARQVKAKERNSAFRENARQNVLRSVLETRAGRAWIYELLGTCHMFQTSFIQGDSHATAYKEGERNIGIQILNAVVMANPEAFPLMLREAKENG